MRITDRELDQRVSKFKESCVEFIDNSRDGRDMKEVCKDFLFELTILRLAIEGYIAQEEGITHKEIL